jgi:branched-chain amino acid transport system substrate-binding protein
MTMRAGKMMFFCSLALAATACGGDDAKTSQNDHTILLGTFMATGTTSSAELLAIREINAAGGITIGGVDYKLDLDRELNDGSITGGVKTVQDFVNHGAVAAIGPLWSSVALGTKPDFSDGVAMAAVSDDLMLISPMATSAAITKLVDHDLVWRTVPSDDYQGSTGAAFLYDQKKARTAALVVRNDPWGTGLADTFTRAFEAKGGKVVSRVTYDDNGNLSAYAFPELSETFKDKPDVVYVCAFDEVAQLTNRIAQEGFLDAYGDTPPIVFGTDATFFASVLTNGDPSVLPLMMGTLPSPNPTSATYLHFAKAHADAGFGEASLTGAYTYDAIYLVALAIQVAGSSDANEFKEQMRAVSEDDGGDTKVTVGEWAKAKAAILDGKGVDFDGSSGPIAFTKDGDPGEGRYTLWKVVPDGKGFTYDMSLGVDIEAQ